MNEFPPIDTVKFCAITTNANSWVIVNKVRSAKASNTVNDNNINEIEQNRKVTSRTSQRTRHIPKVFTPNSNDNKVYCLCQKENTGWYLVCDYRLGECYHYYHAKCVGLSFLKTQEDGENYSNCNDGESYICPLCAKARKREMKSNQDLTESVKGNISTNMVDCDDEITRPCLQTPENQNESAIEGEWNNMDRAEDPQTLLQVDRSDSTHENSRGNPSNTFYDSKAVNIVASRQTDNTGIERIEACSDGYDSEKEGSRNLEFDDDFEFNSEDYDQIDEATALAAALNEFREKTSVSYDTMSRMMDCPKLPHSPFLTVDVPTAATFQLSEHEWNRMKPLPTHPNKLQRCWPDVLASHISKSNAFCTFDFHRHFVPKENSRKRQFPYVFTASGFCIFKHCSCTFSLSLEKKDFDKKIIKVLYNGSVKHAAGERHARFIKGDERRTMIEKFHKGHNKPSVVYQEKKASLPSDALASGNRTGCGTLPTTMRKIASEGRQISYMDKDMFKSLEKVRLNLVQKESSRELPPASTQGFVHMICQFPLIVHMWIEDQVRLWHERCANDVSYLDATGTIIANHNGKRVLYYALVVRHPCEGSPAVPVAEMITSDHRACNIRTFLDSFRQAESKIFGGRVTSPRQLNADYSRAILLAVLREFNNESLCDFFQRAFRILNKNGLESDFSLTVPHVGCSHFMHIVHRKVMVFHVNNAMLVTKKIMQM